MINLIFRARYSAVLRGELRDNVLGTYVVSWFGMGEEMALMTREALGHNYLMLPVCPGWARVSKAAFGHIAVVLRLRSVPSISAHIKIHWGSS